MLKSTFTPGDRVSDRGNGRLGTVAYDPAMLGKYPGYFPVEWDGGTVSVALPSILAPVAAGIEHVSDEDLRAELQRREDEARKADIAAAAEYVRKHPGALHRNTRINELWNTADAAGLNILALTKIWFETYGKKSPK